MLLVFIKQVLIITPSKWEEKPINSFYVEEFPDVVKEGPYYKIVFTYKEYSYNGSCEDDDCEYCNYYEEDEKIVTIRFKTRDFKEIKETIITPGEW